MIDLLAYRRPRSFDELWAAFQEAAPPVIVSAGCTDLVPKNRAGALPAATWLDLRRIPELSAIEVEHDQLRLGACRTHHQVARDPLVRSEMPALATACGAVGSRQIRALGTLGGNASNCSPCADSFLALTALDARVALRSADGRREVPAAELPRAPGETVLSPREIIEAFLVPRLERRRSSFLKLGPRRAVAVAKVSVSASAVVETDQSLRSVRIVMGSVAPTVLRVPEAEALLEGVRPNEKTLTAVADAVTAAIHPIDDVRSSAEYRQMTSGVLARRAIEALLTD